MGNNYRSENILTLIYFSRKLLTLHEKWLNVRHKNYLKNSLYQGQIISFAFNKLAQGYLTELHKNLITIINKFGKA